jgi:hypothetical protein
MRKILNENMDIKDGNVPVFKRSNIKTKHIKNKKITDKAKHNIETNFPFVGHGKIASIKGIEGKSLQSSILKYNKVECPNIKKILAKPNNNDTNSNIYYILLSVKKNT